MTHDARTLPFHGAAAPVLPGEPGQVSLAEARACDPQPTWNRQTPESWVMIKEEYLGGATARQIAVKWRVAPSTLYRHAYQEGWSKKALALVVGEAAQARAAEAEAKEIARLIAAPEPAYEPPLDDVAATPQDARRLTLAALTRCLRTGAHAEAERLGKLAETLGRMIPPPPPDVWTEHDPRLRRVRRIKDRDARINARWADLDTALEASGAIFPVVELIDELVARAADWRDGHEWPPTFAALNAEFRAALGVYVG